MIEDQVVPVIIDIQKLQALNPTPEDVFILSRINGSMSVKQIVQMVGLPRDKVASCLERLEQQKIITLKGAATEKKKPTVSAAPNILQILDEEDRNLVLSQIPRSFRNRIRLLTENLQTMNFFEVLEVTPSASTEEIHTNYLRLVKDFHPDKVKVTKDSAEYKSKVEKIFEKIQEAYQEIQTDGKRATYIHLLMEKKRGKPDPKEKPKYEYKIPRKNTEPSFAKADSQFKMGQKEEKRGNFQAALNFYQMAMTLDPDEKSYQEAVVRIKKMSYKT